MSRIAHAARRELDDQLVEVALGADVDAAGRLVGEAAREGSASSARANMSFCWFPPDSAAGAVSRALDADDLASAY